nr:MAG TPA: hypothetical protein [Caudoviricetes sp.]
MCNSTRFFRRVHTKSNRSKRNLIARNYVIVKLFILTSYSHL